MAGCNRETASSEEPESLPTIGNLPTPNSRGSTAGPLLGHSKTARCRSFPSRHGGTGVTTPAIFISLGGPQAHEALRTLGFLAVPCQSD